MLIMFRTKNFTSFKDDVVLDLRRTSFREHPNHVFKCGDEELLKTIVIYGSNASGKSNLISALSTFERIMLSQFFQDKEIDDITNEIKSDLPKLRLQPFLLSEKPVSEIEFEIIFSYKNCLFQYGYSIENSKICSEWLFIDKEKVFEREKDVSKVSYGKTYETILKDYARLREDRLYLAILDYFVTDNYLRYKIDIFKEFFNSKFNVYFELIFESSIKGLSPIIGMHEVFLADDAFRKSVSEYVRKIDVGIKDIVIEKEIVFNKQTGEKEEKPVARALHNVYDSNGNIVSEKTFDFSYESSGTLRFISYIQDILTMLDGGGVFIVDELSSRLHPLLTKFIVDLFQSRLNKSNAQLIFTTHDTSIMNSDQFRRDEIVFIDKNAAGVSSLYSLSDLQIRQDASFNRDYFRGKYGAIPIIEDIFKVD